MQNTFNKDEKLSQVFFPYSTQRQQDALRQNQRFVHYTSAETAMSIIRTKKVWMRNAICMNDFMEVQYGIDCLFYAYQSVAGKKFQEELNNIFPQICDEIEEIFNSWLEHFKYDTYLTCISEHDNTENDFGRLSMWRGYGKDSGVALVLNNKPFLLSTDALNSNIHPVAYQNKEGVEEQFRKITQNIMIESDFLIRQERETIKRLVFNLFKFAVLCIKHPGFKEEREWRIAYSPTMAVSNYLLGEIRAVKGIPQQIYKISLEKLEKKGFSGTAIPNLIHRIIIGPSEYPIPIAKAFMKILADAGVADSEKKVVISNIPLRR